MWVKVQLVIKVPVVVLLLIFTSDLNSIYFQSIPMVTCYILMHIPLLPLHFDFLMSFLQISLQLIRTLSSGAKGEKWGFENARKALKSFAIGLFRIHTRMRVWGIGASHNR